MINREMIYKTCLSLGISRIQHAACMNTLEKQWKRESQITSLIHMP